jgi:Domain of unknown function (DUF4439)
VTPLQALQRALAGEHAAVYVYGVLGGRLSSSDQPDLAARLSSAYAVHRARRDQLTAMVRAAHGAPVAADTSYVLPTPAVTAQQIETAARVVEQRSSGVYAETVENTSRGNRQWAIDALLDAAVRQLSFGGHPEPWPGVAEL